jgi:hypothetical protein
MITEWKQGFLVVRACHDPHQLLILSWCRDCAIERIPSSDQRGVAGNTAP